MVLAVPEQREEVDRYVVPVVCKEDRVVLTAPEQRQEHPPEADTQV